MALTAARRIRARSAGPDTPAPDQIIVCTTSFEHELALSCAGRLHSETGSGYAPFAIGQLQGASFLVALQVARTLIASDARMGTVLIVAAERWRAPFARVVGTLTTLGDGAAAALVGHHRSPGWCLRSITIRTPARPACGTPETVYVDDTTIVDVIRETCMAAGLNPSAIDWILPARINPVLAREISARAGLLPARIPQADANDTGYLCAADTPACLDALLCATTPSHGQHLLLWSAGFQGQGACAILEFRDR
jgi:3-oxoacyl-[acyl-carrier-protein] synthase III